MELLTPGALARLDDALVRRFQRGEALLGVAISCAITIALGAAAYGAAMGLWRAPEQALYVAIKLPLLFFLIAISATGASAMLAALLRSGLSLAQTACAILLALAVTSAILGTLAPVAIFFVASAPAPDPAAVGSSIDDPIVQPSMAVARALLLGHVLAIAGAGIAGVLRLRALLARLIPDAAIARRVLVTWLALLFLVGAQLSWLLRPFFGKPHLAPSFFRDDALRGNFFEEAATLFGSAFGVLAPLAAIGLGVTLAIGLAWALRATATTVSVELGEPGLAIVGTARVIPWSSIAWARPSGSAVLVTLEPDATLARETLRIPVRARHAHALAERIELERARVRAGPFRTQVAGRAGAEIVVPIVR